MKEYRYIYIYTIVVDDGGDPECWAGRAEDRGGDEGEAEELEQVEGCYHHHHGNLAALHRIATALSFAAHHAPLPSLPLPESYFYTHHTQTYSLSLTNPHFPLIKH